MKHERRSAAAASFAVAFAVAVGLTAFSRLRPHAAPPTAARPIAQPVTHATDTEIAFRVEQAVIDFAARRSRTTLKLTPPANEDLPARLWVWADYREHAPGARRWTNRPQEVEVTGARRLNVVAECEIEPESSTSKPTFYARIHVAAQRPDSATLARSIEDFDITTATPVILQNTNE